MKKAVKYIYSVNPLFVYLKKHFCPQCGEKLKTHYLSKIVNSNSFEAKDYDFSLGDTYLIGDVDFRSICFKCLRCNTVFSLQEIKKYEKDKKN